MIKLLPCPFCGNTCSVIYQDEEYGPGGPVPTYWKLDCGGCNVELIAETKEQLIKHWNTRKDSK